ncbi:hypothetical protein [Arundinibacter roseus]|uniref:DUF1648 domain-containing protein n=1 Tax=Arundinibacter roseus TaxID=2070510 RepID=A0A4R4KKR1_9BACT|nr:hypothetical protein [Arundinibacter roseus]TDB68768.1 hypothetical protein EZE20_00020 [Arundinibacter roseus]
MKVTTFAIKVWRWFSVVLVIGALAWTYSLLPDLVAVGYAASGMADHYVEKSTIFYIVMGLIIFNNVVIMATARQIPKVPAMMMPIPNRAAWAANRDVLNEHLTNWLLCLVAAINTILALSLFSLATVNSSQYKSDIFDFAWLFYLGFGMLTSIVLALPIRLMRAPAPEISLD